MTEQPRNWDKELAEIDKAIQEQRGGGAAGPAGGAVAPRSLPPPAPAAGGVAPARRGSMAVTWFWVLLAVGLAVALPLWPYQRACGLQAVFFIGAAGITAVVGMLAAASSWASRRGLAHIVSLLVVTWAAAVAASEILPRVGYAREVRTWTCPATPAGTPAATGTQPGSQPAPAPTEPAAPSQQPMPTQQPAPTQQPTGPGTGPASP